MTACGMCPHALSRLTALWDEDGHVREHLRNMFVHVASTCHTCYSNTPGLSRPFGEVIKGRALEASTIRAGPETSVFQSKLFIRIESQIAACHRTTRKAAR